MGRRQLLHYWWQWAPSLLLCCFAACRTPSDLGADAPIEPRFQNSLRVLGLAIESGEDESARRILKGLLALGPTGHTLALIEDFQDILDGRLIADQLEFDLVDEQLLEDPSNVSEPSYALTLRVTNRANNQVQIFFPPPTLHHLDHQLFLSGSESKTMDSRIVDGLNGLAIAVGETVRIELGEYSRDTGKALARRERWKIKLLSGELVFEERRLPFSAAEVDFCEVIALADYLSKEPIESGSLLEYVQAQSINMPALLERCVRIPASDWDETLERLAPIVEAMEDHRVTDIAPVLRWLSRSGLIGGDARTWRFALSQLVNQRPENRDALDLPDPPVERPAPQQ